MIVPSVIGESGRGVPPPERPCRVGTSRLPPTRSTVFPPRCLAFDLAGRLFVRRRRTGAAPGSSWSGESFPPCLLVVADEVGGRAPVLPVPTDATVLGSGAESSPRPRRSNEEEGAHFRGFSRRYRPIAVEQEWNTGGYFGGIWGREGPARASREIKKILVLQRVSVERVTGIEPALSAWEADVLPLNYTRMLGAHQLCPMPRSFVVGRLHSWR